MTLHGVLVHAPFLVWCTAVPAHTRQRHACQDRSARLETCSKMGSAPSSPAAEECAAAWRAAAECAAREEALRATVSAMEREAKRGRPRNPEVDSLMHLVETLGEENSRLSDENDNQAEEISKLRFQVMTNGGNPRKAR